MLGHIDRVADAMAAILARERLDYSQTKAVFKAARQRAGLKPPKEKRGATARLNLEEELRFLEQAYPHLLRQTVATRLLALGMAITDVQRFLGQDDISTTRLYAETSVAMLRRKFDQITAPVGRALVRDIAATQGEVVAAFACVLLHGDRRRLVSTTGA